MMSIVNNFKFNKLNDCILVTTKFGIVLSYITNHTIKFKMTINRDFKSYRKGRQDHGMGGAPIHHNISTFVVLDFKDLTLSNCTQMLEQVKLYIRTYFMQYVMFYEFVIVIC
jgi:hypothetical protein